MRDLYIVIRNALLFFFLVVIFDRALQINNGTPIDKIIVALVFGVFMAFIPTLLKFFKLPVNTGSLILMGVIVSFIFFFVGLYVFQFITITGQPIDLGVAFLGPIKLIDKTFALVFLSFVAGLTSVLLELISKGK